MQIKKIQNVDVGGKDILMRVDFNVSLNEKGNIIEAHKILAAQETLNFLLKNKARKIFLLTHFGRPEGKAEPEFSVKKIIDDVEKILQRKIYFIDDCIGKKVQQELKNGENQIVLLENVRFYAEEEKNDFNFAKSLATGFHIFVNEAFGASHRDHASLGVITDILPSFAGFWLQKEIENLEKIKIFHKSPAVAIIGGAKIETKLDLIKMFEERYDWVLVGGKISVEALEKKLQFSKKVILPVDFTGGTLDIGSKTIKLFIEKIREAKTIVWNGPMGKFEEKPFDEGTRLLVKSVAENTEAFSLIGGGESVQALAESGFWNEISFVSTGGGAMLSFLVGEKMPPIDRLLEK